MQGTPYERGSGLGLRLHHFIGAGRTHGIGVTDASDPCDHGGAGIQFANAASHIEAAVAVCKGDGYERSPGGATLFEDGPVGGIPEGCTNSTSPQTRDNVWIEVNDAERDAEAFHRSADHTPKTPVAADENRRVLVGRFRRLGGDAATHHQARNESHQGSVDENGDECSRQGRVVSLIAYDSRGAGDLYEDEREFADLRQ